MSGYIHSPSSLLDMSDISSEVSALSVTHVGKVFCRVFVSVNVADEAFMIGERTEAVRDGVEFEEKIWNMEFGQRDDA